jgi:hypothetical protein
MAWRRGCSNMAPALRTIGQPWHSNDVGECSAPDLKPFAPPFVTHPHPTQPLTAPPQTAPHCPMLPHTAAHCPTLPHIAPHCPTPHCPSLSHTAPWATHCQHQQACTANMHDTRGQGHNGMVWCCCGGCWGSTPPPPHCTPPSCNSKHAASRLVLRSTGTGAAVRACHGSATRALHSAGRRLCSPAQA